MKVFLCAIAKCENLYIKEWVEWHKNLGFDEIYIYDNNDTDGERIEDVTREYNYVHTINVRGKRQSACEIQVGCYNSFIRDYSKGCDWFMFLDIDEFLNLKGLTIKEYLSQSWVRNAKAIRFFWKCYTDNNQLKYEEGKVRDRFNIPCPNDAVNAYYKQIYRSRLSNFKILNVHYSNRLYQVFYCDGSLVNGYIPITHDETHINHNDGYVEHYVTKSLEEYINIKRKRRREGSSKKRLSRDFYFKYNEWSEEKSKLLNEAFGIKDEDKPTPPPTPSKSLNSYVEGVSVCVTAWKTAEYIEECLDSIVNQTWFKNHDNWEILLGVDHCEETLEKVKSIMHKYKNLKVFMMNKNVGTYVTSNTIMKEARYKWLLRFDSDDIMLPNMVEIIMKNIGDSKFIRFDLQNFGAKTSRFTSYGAVMFSNTIFKKFNGYKDWVCSADYDLIKRVEKHYKIKTIHQVLFKRRVHTNNLTTNKNTNSKSDIRKKYSLILENDNNYNTLEKCINADCITESFNVIYDYFNKLSNTLKDDKIIVSFTSWKKRISNCAHIVDLMVKQTLKPDKIILNLSTDEFKNKEADLPKELIDKQNDIFEIYWVKENTKAYKKIIPTLNRFPNDVIISVDDDIEYPLNFIEKIYKRFLSNGKTAPVTGGDRSCKWENNIYTHHGAFSLVKKDFFGPYLNDLYNNVVLKNGIDTLPNDDLLYTYSALLNNKRYSFNLEGLDMQTLRSNSVLNKKDSLLAEYKDKLDSSHKIIRDYIEKKYNKTYNDLLKAPIIVNITTWVNRDHCLYEMLLNLKKQTLPPDKIVLWLSEEEYDKNNLPQSIQKCINENLLTDVMWVQKNTKGHKRYECFKYFNDCYNILLDDDILYEPTFIEKLVTESIKHEDCITVYSSRGVDYNGVKFIEKPFSKEPSVKNMFIAGRCCFPPFIFPFDAYENENLRNKYVVNCDESWYRVFFIKHNISINVIYQWDIKHYNTIDGSQNNSLWNINKTVLRNGMREKEKNFFNAIKITHTEKLCKKIWPNIGIDDYTLQK